MENFANVTIRFIDKIPYVLLKGGYWVADAGDCIAAIPMWDNTNTYSVDELRIIAYTMLDKYGYIMEVNSDFMNKFGSFDLDIKSLRKCQESHIAMSRKRNKKHIYKPREVKFWWE